jgi:hypothetical protein
MDMDSNLTRKAHLHFKRLLPTHLIHLREEVSLLRAFHKTAEAKTWEVNMTTVTSYKYTNKNLNDFYKENYGPLKP